ncbi:MAG: hypothetical protein RLZ44_1822 [Pseudomonadota bacterium]|jgi:hypothetical protein
MPLRPNSDLRDSSVLIALLGLLFFASPLVTWWAADGALWYVPYLLWALIIVLAGLIHALHARHGL